MTFITLLQTSERENRARDGVRHTRHYRRYYNCETHNGLQFVLIETCKATDSERAIASTGETLT